MAETERRFTPGVVELRSTADNGVAFGGYALKFGKLSNKLPAGYVERVAGPQTVRKTVADGGDVVARMHHKDEYLLGRVSSGTLRLKLDERGLDYTVDRPDTSYARDLEALARRGDIRHSSFAFRNLEDEWGFTESGFPLRTLHEIQLVDVAPVVSPAYNDTPTGLRSLADHTGRDFDEVMEAATTGHLAELISKPRTVIAVRGFNAREPRDGNGKWSESAVGEVEQAAEEFAAVAKLNTKHSGGLALAPAPDGGVHVQVRYGDAEQPPALAHLSAQDVAGLNSHVAMVKTSLAERQELARKHDESVLNSPDEAKRRELRGQMKADLEATGKPKGHPDRLAITEDYDRRIAESVGEQPANPYDDGSLLGEADAKFGSLHVGAALGDTGASFFVGSGQITDESVRDEHAVELSPKQMDRLLSMVNATAGPVDAGDQRSLTEATADEGPGAPHLSVAVRARRLALMQRKF